MLLDCDYVLASEIIKDKFAVKSVLSEATGLLESFLADPCFKTAMPLIKRDPLFVNYFIECKPNGLYSRLKRKKENPVQYEVEAASVRAVNEMAASSDVKNNDVVNEPMNEIQTGRASALSNIDAINPYSTKFPNVILYLKDSIKELQMQIEQCEKELSTGLYHTDHPEAVKLKKWMNTCREGVKEFTEAVKILEKYNK